MIEFDLVNTFKKIIYGLNNEALTKLSCKLLLFFNARNNGIKINYSDEQIEIVKNDKKLLISSKHLIYANDIVNDFEYYFSKVLSEKIEGYETVDFSKPKLQTYKSGLSLYFSSFVESTDVIDSYLKKHKISEGDIVIDCGAYCGVITYFFSKLVGDSGKVYAFEPDDINYEMLLKNIELHQLTNVIPVKKGLWSSACKLSFNSDGSLGGTIENVNERPFNKIVSSIDTITLEGIFSEFNIDKPAFVKIDIEGAEIEALEGAKEFIKNKDLNFAVASYHVVDGEMTCYKLEKIFSEIGYEYVTLGLDSKDKLGNVITYAWSRKSD